MIDTQRSCLVNSQGAENYAALSCVWGGANILQTTLANKDVILEEESLTKNYSSPIPATVSDAILLAAAIGVRYLWVDNGHDLRKRVHHDSGS